MNRKAFLACVLMCVILTGCETHNRCPVSFFVVADIAQAFTDGGGSRQMYRAFTFGKHYVERGGVIHVQAQRVIFQRAQMFV